jgi:hypothetical protein
MRYNIFVSEENEHYKPKNKKSKEYIPLDLSLPPFLFYLLDIHGKNPNGRGNW